MAHESSGFGTPSVAYFNNQFIMFYVAHAGVVAHAVSQDGLNWHKPKAVMRSSWTNITHLLYNNEHYRIPMTSNIVGSFGKEVSHVLVACFQ